MTEPNTTERGDRGIPPGEMLWTCHGTMFQRPPGQPDKWDDLPIPEKVCWAYVEDQVLKALAVDAELRCRQALTPRPSSPEHASEKEGRSDA